MKKLIEELRRRHVFQVTAAYAVAAWFLVQFSDIVLPTFNVPGWVNQVLIFALMAFFPLAMILAWVYDLKPLGFTRTPPSDENPEQQADTVTVSGSQALPDDNSVAILPLTNLSPVQDNAYFAEGIHDEVLNQLSKVADIRVISRTATNRYRDTNLTTHEIARELRVRLLVEGSVRFNENRVRILVQLIRAEDDTQIWSEIYENELDDIFRIQSDVALNVARAMKARLMPEEIARIEKPATVNLDAYKLFLKAIAREKEHSFSLDNASGGWVEPGLRDIKEALRLDPEFAGGYAQLGWLKIMHRYTHFDVREGQKLLREAKESAEKALELDPNLIRAYSVLAFVAFEQHHWEEWEKLDRKAISFPEAKSGEYLNFADRLGRVGRFEEARVLIDKAIKLDPARTLNREYAVYYRVVSGDYKKALLLADEYRSSGGSDHGYHLYRALALYFLGDEVKAKGELGKVAGNIQGLHINMAIYYGFITAKLLGKQQVLTLLSQLESDVSREFMDFGCAIGCSDKDRAFSILQRYMKGGHVVSDLGEIMDELRADPRWTAVDDYLRQPLTDF